MMLLLAGLHLGVLQDPQRPAEIPMQAGLTIVQAVSGDAYQGRDYEAVIAIATRWTRAGSRSDREQSSRTGPVSGAGSP